MTTVFVRHARLTVLVILFIVASGLAALISLGRQEDPSLIERFAVIVAPFPGASAERVEALIADPLDDAILELAEVGEVETTIRTGVAVMQVQLREDLSEAAVDRAWTLVREQVDKAAQGFPDGALTPDIDRQYVGAATVIVSVGWADGRDGELGIVSRLARDLEERLQSLGGTEETRLFGAAEEEVQVQIDADRLAALGLSVNDAARALAGSDAKAPAGAVRAPGVNLGVEVAGEFDSLDRIREAPLAVAADGRTVRFGEVADISKAERDPPARIALDNGRRVVYVAGYLQPGLRVDAWTENARGVIEAFKSELPRGIQAEVVFEQNQYVISRLNGLFANLMQSALIVFAVLFLIMGWRAALIVGSALPLTVLLVLLLQRMIGEPLHQMSVTGLVIALGLLIDNAIVMVDEYRLKRARGANPIDAVDQATRHLFAPLTASTVTTMLAFAPIALMPGVAGEFISMIGVSVTFAVGASLLLALTIVPALAAWFDREPKPGEAPSFWVDGIRWPGLAAPYRSSLELVARKPWLGIAIGVSAPVFGFAVAATLPMQFFPPTDRDMLQLELVLPAQTSIEETERRVNEASAIIKDVEGVVSIGWMIGGAPPRVYYNVLGSREDEPGFAAGWVRTTSPKATRRIVNDLAPRLRDAFPDAQLLVLPFEQGPPVPAPIELRLIGPDFETLDRLGQEVRAILAESKNITYTTAGLKLGAPVAKVQADESATRLTGRGLNEIAAALRADLDGVTGGSVLEGVEELPVRVILNDEARSGLDAVRGKALPGLGGAQGLGGSESLGGVVGALGSVTLEPNISVIPRYMGQRDNPIYGYVAPYTLPDIAFTDFRRRLDESGFETPPGYTLEFGGEAAERGEALGGLFSSAAPLIVLMVAALVLAFNSFSYAGVVGVVGFLSLGLAFLGVWMFGEPNGFNAIVGAMGLLGLGINASIVVLSALKTDAAALTGDARAIANTTYDATSHIVATTLTTVGGFVPLIVSGDSFWLPLAAAIAGGVAGSAVLAIYFAPAMFAILTRRSLRRQARKAARAGAALSTAAE